VTQQVAIRTPSAPPSQASPQHGKRVVYIALGLVALQLAYRGWCGFSSGWVGDDLVMMDRVIQPGGSDVSGLLQGYGSHLMPGALLLTSLITKIAPYNFTLAAALMLLMQALAGIGMVRFLVVAFGPRPGILAPLALYLASPFVVTSTVWWTPGSHHFIVHAALVWALASQVSYLRSRRWTSAVSATLWVVVGLLFFEKSLLIIGAMAIVTVAYFTQGSTRERLLTVWRTYRLSVLLNLVLGVVFLGLYTHFVTIQFGARDTVRTPIGPVIDTMVLRSWATGVFGGPLAWSDSANGPTVVAQPSPWVVVLCIACLVLFIGELARSRTKSLRGLVVPAWFLGANVLLVATARASMIGPEIGFDLRYIGEMAPATAIGLALATMPILGAVERVEVNRPSAFLDQPRRVAFACVVVVVLSLVSTTRYVDGWNAGRQPSAAWLDNLLDDARVLPHGAHVVDSAAPQFVAWPISYPANMASHLIRPLRSDLHFGGLGGSTLRAVGPDGRIRPATVSRLRSAVPSRDKTCGYRVARHPITVPLDGQVAFPGLWVHVGYLASGDSAVSVTAGGASYKTSVAQGFHNLYFRAGTKPFKTIRIGGLVGSAQLCTNDVVVGQVVPKAGR